MRHNGLYVTDQVKVNKRTTLNIGVRWDSYTSFYDTENIRPDCLFCGYFYQGLPLYPGGPTLPVTPYANGVIPGATTSTLPHQFAPRIGLAIDLTGKGR